MTQAVANETMIAPRLGVLLTRMADTPDLDAALYKVLTDYLDLKSAALRAVSGAFEAKWGQTFAGFGMVQSAHVRA